MVLEMRSGDIILFASNQPANGWSKLIYSLQRSYDGEARHAEVIYDYDGRTGMVKCYGSNFDNVKFRAHIVDKPYVCIIRPKEDISWVSNTTVHEVKHSLENGGDISYDFVGLMNAAINAFLHTVSFGTYRKRRIFSDSKKFFCSELAVFLTSLSYNKIGKTFEMFDEQRHHIPLTVVSPSDLYRAAKNNQAFTIIKDFEM